MVQGAWRTAVLLQMMGAAPVPKGTPDEREHVRVGLVEGLGEPEVAQLHSRWPGGVQQRVVQLQIPAPPHSHLAGPEHIKT